MGAPPGVGPGWHGVKGQRRPMWCRQLRSERLEIFSLSIRIILSIKKKKARKEIYTSDILHAYSIAWYNNFTFLLELEQKFWILLAWISYPHFEIILMFIQYFKNYQKDDVSSCHINLILMWRSWRSPNIWWGWKWL